MRPRIAFGELNASAKYSSDEVVNARELAARVLPRRSRVIPHTLGRHVNAHRSRQNVDLGIVSPLIINSVANARSSYMKIASGVARYDSTTTAR